MRRYQKRLLIIFGSLFGTGLFFFVLFNLLVLNLFEGKIENVFELVPPKGVSYVIATKGLGPGLDELPESAFLRDLRKDPAYEKLVQSEAWRAAQERYGIGANLERLQEMREQLPFDVLEGVLGEDLVVAGNPVEGSVNEWDFLVYTRISKLIKIGVDFCDNALVKGRLDKSMQIERVVGERYRELGIEQDGKLHRFYFARMKDVLVVTNKRDLMDSVMRLRERGPNLSLGYDKTFQKAAFPPAQQPTEYSYYLNLALLWQTLGIDEKLDEFPPQVRMALQFFNAERLSLGTGKVVLDGVPEITGDFVLSEEGIKFEHEYRIFNTEAVAVDEAIDRFADFVPLNNFYFVFMRCPAPDLFTLLSSQVSDQARQLINETLAEKPVYQNFDDFLQQTAANFGERLAISVSKINYVTDERRPLPAVTLYFDVADQLRLDQFLEYLTGDEFALSDMTHEEYLGVRVSSGRQKLPVIAWARELAYATIDDTFILSTSRDAVQSAVEVKMQGSASLLRDTKVGDVLRSLPDSVNAFAYWDTQLALDWLSSYVPYLVERKADFPDDQWPVERMKAEQSLRQAKPGLRRDSPEFAAEVDAMLDKVEVEFERQERERWSEIYDRRIEWGRVLGRGAGSIEFLGNRIRSFMRAGFAFQD